MKSTDLQPDNTNQHDLLLSLQRDADSCVMCGMCLPHCPTYKLYQNEAESPRGRISVMQAYAQGRLKPDTAMLTHLDHCLGCMACEAMCPSKVAFGRLKDTAQTLLVSQRSRPDRRLTLLLYQTRRPNGLNRYAQALRWYKTSGLQKLAGGLLRLTGNDQGARSNDILGLAQTARLDDYYPAANTPIADIALFTGCTGTSFDGETLLNAIKLLTRLGYNTHIPRNQQCCGALHQHHGQAEQAQQLLQQNRLAFGSLTIANILYTANGCGAQLAGANLPVPVMDITRFILSAPAWTTTRFKPLKETVLLHESCSSRNKLNVAGVMRRIMQAIPDLQIHDAISTDCCGAGSSHQLQFPEQTDALLASKIQAIKNLQPIYLLSDNIGCSLNIKNGLNQAGLDIEVIHPITLLARQLA